MAFDTPENRHRYEVARTQHDQQMSAKDRNGGSYRRGWNGCDYHSVDDDFEHWCAGRENQRSQVRTSN
jgi:hypothetical protein